MERPGQIVSVDTMTSPTPGLIAQMAGFLTSKCCRCATTFVDNHSGFSCVHLQKTQTAKETLEGKELFKRKVSLLGVSIEHCHSDNGIFSAKAWREDCAKKRQGVSRSSVNAHFQSGIAERCIRELQELARTVLLHAKSRWKEAVNTHLWPCASEPPATLTMRHQPQG